MISKSDFFISKVLGADFMGQLQKSALFKPGTQTILDLEEIKVGLKVVPRVVLSFLKKELGEMEIHESKKVELPFAEHTILNVNKVERDTYTGNIEQNNKVIVDYKFRSLPGLGLVIMSALELYDLEDLKEEKEIEPNISEQVQKMIDERLTLNDLVEKIVDKKISERDAIEQLILAKLSDVMKQTKEAQTIPLDDEVVIAMKASSDKALAEAMKEDDEESLPLSDFMETISKKRAAKGFNIKLAKSGHIDCPDCGQTVFSSNIYSGCVCMGENSKSQIHIQKSEDGVQVRFGRDWSLENIELLLEVLRGKNG